MPFFGARSNLNSRRNFTFSLVGYLLLAPHLYAQTGANPQSPNVIVLAPAQPKKPVIPDIYMMESASVQNGTIFSVVEQGIPRNDTLQVPVKIGERNGLVKFETIPGKHRPYELSKELRASSVHLIRLGGTTQNLSAEHILGLDQAVDQLLSRALLQRAVPTGKDNGNFSCILSQSDRPLWITVTDLYLQSGANLSDIPYSEKTTVFRATCSSTTIQPGFDLMPILTYNTNQGTNSWVPAPTPAATQLPTPNKGQNP